MNAADVKSAREFFVSLGVQFASKANALEDVVTVAVDYLVLCSVLAELPDEMVVRVRCLPDLFEACA